VIALSISAGAATKLAAICRDALPHEAAGFLLGRVDDGIAIVTDIEPARESATDIGSFAIPDHELRRAAAYAADRGERIVALYHSHPSGETRLSASDRAALRHSRWPWVIVTVAMDGGDATLSGYAPGEGGIAIRITTIDPAIPR